MDDHDVRLRIVRVLVTIVLVGGGAVACAEGELARSANSPATSVDGLSVKIKITEFGFEPSEVQVVHGASVRFLIRNVGLLPHDVALDRGPAGEDPARPRFGSVNVASLGGGTLDVVFDEPGEYVLGCTEPGHWTSGMKARVEVT